VAERAATGAGFTCNFLYMCTGYYNYAKGIHARVPGRGGASPAYRASAAFWPHDIDYKGKKVVVIGSGATAVTLVPEWPSSAAHVTMLQRSPTYVVSRPSEDSIANWLRAMLPSKLAYGITRWKNVLSSIHLLPLARKIPEG
jgi:monooxygenase